MTSRLILYIVLFGSPFWGWSQTVAPVPTNEPVRFQNIASFVEAARTNAPIRARLQGVVTYTYRQSSYYMKDGSGGLFVSTPTNIVLEPGMVVEAIGTSLPAGFSPVLRQETVRDTGRRETPESVAVTAQEIMGGRHDMQLVSLRATLLDVVLRPDRTLLLRMYDAPVPFSAELDAEALPLELGELRPQSVVRLTGVCTIGGDRGVVRNFRVLLRSAEDVEVLEAPPWWTFKRTMRVVIVLGVLILAGLVWVAALNHQVRQQTRELRARFQREAELEDQYHDLFENAQELVFTLDIQGRLLSLNKATEAALATTRYDAIEKNFADFILAEDRERFLKYLNDCAGQNSGKLAEFTIRSTRGQQAALELSCHLMKRPRTTTEVQVIARDISERKRAEAEIHRLTYFLENRVAERTGQLEAANKELEAFSYSVSHDLRAPLRAIDGFSRILMEENFKSADDDTRHLLEGIHKNSKRMAQLIDDLLQFSRLTRSSLVTAEVDLDAIFRNAVEEQRALQPNRQIDLALEVLPRVLGDSAMLHQAVENLVSNAIKYSRGQGTSRIEVGARDQGDETVISVKDNGVGFDMRYADKLFQVFQRLHSEKEFEGTGVGLAIVQRIIQRHGGKVWAEATPGEGATFFFSLPKNSGGAEREKTGFAV